MQNNKKDKIIGFTDGCYDLFHIGHLNLLKKCKEYCDYLVVGVNTDEYIKEYKNKTPIIPLEERMEIIKSIKYVDEVVAINKDNYGLPSLKKYNADYIFVGDDWKGTEKWNKLEKLYNENGIKVVYFPYTKHISTTILRKKIKEC